MLLGVLLLLLLDFDDDVQLLFRCGLSERKRAPPPYRTCGDGIKPRRQPDEPVVGADAVGDIKADPPQMIDEHFGPGVVRWFGLGPAKEMVG